MITAAPSVPASAIQSPPAKTRWLFAIILVALYLAVALPFVFTHAIWRDEAQAFLLARDSATPWDLVLNARYEGHPLLWHMCLWVLTRFTVNPLAMLLLHLAMSAASVYLMARYAPFLLITKVLFAFSYFAIFEYAIVARNYQPMLLLALIFCILWQRRRTAFLLQSFILGLLAHTNVFGTLIALTLFSLMLWEMCATRAGWQQWRQHYIACASAILLFIALTTLAVFTLHPPADYGYARDWYWDLQRGHLFHTLGCAWSGLVPIPHDRLNFWSGNILPPREMGWAGLYVLIAASLLLLYSPRALWVFLVASAACLTFCHVKYPGSVRHHGALFVTLICASWIALAPRPHPSGCIRMLFKIPLQLALMALLGAHVAGAAIALKHSWQEPFSNGKAAAAFLKNKMTDELLVTEDAIKTTPILAYLPGRQIYIPEGDRWGTFAIWNSDKARTSASRAARQMADEKHRSFIVILHGSNRRVPNGAEELARFGGSCTTDDYTLYRVRPRTLMPPSAATQPEK